MKATTCDVLALGARLKAAREALGLSRPAFATECGGVTVRTLENNEGGANEAGACLIAAFVRLGINANWLLTGDGTMFILPERSKAELLENFETWRKDRGGLDDKAAIAEYVSAYNTGETDTVARIDVLNVKLLTELWIAWRLDNWSRAPAINIDALVQAFAVTVQTAPSGEALAQSARKAVEFYLYCLNKGLITPDGEGSGPAKKPA